MTEYAPRGSQDHNSLFENPHVGMSHYSNGNGSNYLYNNGQIQYPTASNSYAPYSPTYLPNHHGLPQSSTSVYMPNATSIGMQYQTLPPARDSFSQHPRNMPHSMCQYSTLPTQRQPPRLSVGTDLHLSPSLVDTEPQESINEETMLSEPVMPPLEGYPDVKDFDELMRDYVESLSPKKRDKALINARRATNIRAVLIDKKTTSVESAQFRFWVKKMFTLLPNDAKTPDRRKKICHEGKPVAVREKLYKILIRAHKLCQHGGRDKTSLQVRRVYSWVPKELISRFVKLCPTCQVRRGAGRTSPPGSDKSPEDYGDSPQSMSPNTSRRDSIATKRGSVTQSPLSMSGFSSTFAQQNRWMAPLQPSETKYSSTAYSTTVNGDAGAYGGSIHDANATQPSVSSNYIRGLTHMSYGNMSGTSTSGFPSSHVRSTGTGAVAGAETGSWQTAPPVYGIKQEHQHY